MSDSPQLCYIMGNSDIHQIGKLTPHPEISTFPLAFSVIALCGLSQATIPLFTAAFDNKPTCPDCLKKLPRFEHPPGGVVNGGHGIPKIYLEASDTNVAEAAPIKTIFHEGWSKDRKKNE